MLQVFGVNRPGCVCYASCTIDHRESGCSGMKDNAGCCRMKTIEVCGGRKEEKFGRKL